ncbi:ABC transporter ATP-binding protein [Acidocella aminolytica]|uniref:ABC transporter n=1 Tax=Acidocella aminolytica 101 = DSM 11237 TaxID=1120923 RepID=A0A0D6PCN1_9PROT|nr:ABC transporter ATP-binding protein [Acidocella aminolytica]GAN79530.1 ABC transporter [Acidocella aminolytica 101 = DSM 11237]GBQ32663.1 spermidine/putrescine ABC transporter ATP-binding protein [Acidocella aminolytica 101 = DSM 11237]SHF34390.1 iron(III) transport system ATP-binding protein [Acidocella aminolytica 101 = DSM 11237]
MIDLTVSNLKKTFGNRTILHAIDLTVSPAHLLAVLGPSGSGKTTLLRLICGFERCDAGTIRIGDEVVARPGLHMAPERRRVGYVAQDGALFPHLSVRENIVFGLSRTERRRGIRANELLDLVGLPQAYADRAPYQLSGGEQQRVALARALAPQPQLVLLDEPFSALDAGLRAETRKAILEALRLAKATAILVTHDQAEALSLSDEVAVLLDGNLAQVATPATLYNKPKNAAVARFLGETNLIPGLIQGRSVDCALGQLALSSELPAGSGEVLIRPEQIRIDPCSEGTSLPATVTAIDYYGHDASISLRMSDLDLIARVSGPLLLRVGQQVGIAIEDPVRAFG